MIFYGYLIMTIVQNPGINSKNEIQVDKIKQFITINAVFANKLFRLKGNCGLIDCLEYLTF